MNEAPVIEDVPHDLLTEIPAVLADLYREDPGRFKIRGVYLPDLDKPKSAHITILTHNGELIEKIKLDDHTEAIEVFNHPASYSKLLAEHCRALDRPGSKN